MQLSAVIFLHFAMRRIFCSTDTFLFGAFHLDYIEIEIILLQMRVLVRELILIMNIA